MRYRLLGFWAGLVMVGVLTWAAPAFAHAFLVSSTPSAGAVLLQTPKDVVLRYTQRPDATLSQFAVYDVARNQVSTAPAVQESTVTVPLEALKPGTYTLRWRVVSADDGHTTSGSFSFAVWHGGPLPAVAGRSGQTNAGVQGGAWGSIARALSFGALFAVAGAVFVRLALGHPVRGRTVLGAGLALVLAQAWSFGVQGAQSTGVGLGRFLTPAYLAAALSAPFGRLAAVETVAGAAAALLLAIGGRAGRTLSALAALVAVAAFAKASHPAASAHPTLGLVVDGLHLASAAAWAGGLGWLLASRPALPALVPTFSRWALGLMAAIIITGFGNALFTVHAWTALLHTLYGYLLDAKVGLVIVVLLAARFSIAAARGGRGAAARRPMAVEAAAVIAILGVVGVLVGAPPAVVAPIRGAFFQQTAVVAGRQVALTVAPAQVGTNTVTVRVTGSNGHPVTGAEVHLRIRSLDMDMGTSTLPLAERGGGAYAAPTGVFSMVGTWEVTAVGAGWSTHFSVPVALPGGSSACDSGFDPDLRATAYPLAGGANVLAVAPGDAADVLAGTENGFTFTRDAGQTWQTVAPAKGQTAAAAAIAAGTAPAWYAATSDHLWVSTDRGNTWQPRPVPSHPVYALLADPWHAGGLWAASDVGISYSADQGRHWQLDSATTSARAISSLAADPTTRGRLYGGGLDGIVVSQDGGVQWRVAEPAAKSVFGFAFPAQHPGTVWASAMEQGIWVTRDGGQTWQRSDSGVSNPGGMGVATWGSGQTVLAGTMGGGVVRSDDYGATWHTAGCPAAVVLQVSEAVGPAGSPVLWLGDQSGAVKVEFAHTP